jgi:antitoxin component of MazEF toxin-antitoxin module
MIKKVIKIGNSHGITLPTELVHQLGWGVGDRIELFSNGSELRIVPVRKIRPVKIGGILKDVPGGDISLEEIKIQRREMWGKRFEE